jgi:hypothetical protein
MPKFSYWPFQISAGPEPTAVWADRTELRKELDGLLLGVKPSRPSTFINIWAYYGAGKTHALRYLERSARNAGLWSVYAVMPKGAANFGDVYTAIASELTDAQLLVAQDALERDFSDIGQSMHRALRARSIGGPTLAFDATAYLRGRKTTSRQRRDLAVSVDLNHHPTAAEALALMLRALGTSRGVVVLLDEVQDLSGMRDRSLSETDGLLQKVFDEVQFGMRIVASFTTGIKDTIREVLGDALYHRASRLIEIPEFSKDEAIEFLADLIRPATTRGEKNIFAPFSEAEMVAMIQSILDGEEKLVPREIIKGADNMYQRLGE